MEKIFYFEGIITCLKFYNSGNDFACIGEGGKW